MEELLTIRQASEFMSEYLDKKVTPSNISYLIQYGRVKKNRENGSTQIAKQDLLRYFEGTYLARQKEWKNQLGNDLNWNLSFEQCKESETTKHVHRLHPYKGKFIPQLVEYFLDTHTDEFKKESYFQKGDIILDPFCGSGTTLVQCAELGLHALGIDVSAFNSLISNIKVGYCYFENLRGELHEITKKLTEFVKDSKIALFEDKLTKQLNEFNNKYFPAPDYKYKVKNKKIDEDAYSKEQYFKFLKTYNQLIKEYGIKLQQNTQNNFIDKWYLYNVRKEIDFVLKLIEQIKNPQTRQLASVILSRTIRSSRATTHADLATLKEPVITTYYCAKHGKICKPLFSILSWWKRYSVDTINRLSQFAKLRTSTQQICLTGDSRNIDILRETKNNNNQLMNLIKNKRIKGIFSSPPYVGLIDYHEQHAYAYDLFGFKRNDQLEIGALYQGKGKEARESYVDGIAAVLNNCKQYLADDSHIFLVANDKYNLYPRIAEKASLQIVNQYKRPVLNRTEKDKGAYCEIIFHLRAK